MGPSLCSDGPYTRRRRDRLEPRPSPSEAQQNGYPKARRQYPTRTPKGRGPSRQALLRSRLSKGRSTTLFGSRYNRRGDPTPRPLDIKRLPRQQHVPTRETSWHRAHRAPAPLYFCLYWTYYSTVWPGSGPIVMKSMPSLMPNPGCYIFLTFCCSISLFCFWSHR